MPHMAKTVWNDSRPSSPRSVGSVLLAPSSPARFLLLPRAHNTRQAHSPSTACTFFESRICQGERPHSKPLSTPSPKSSPVNRTGGNELEEAFTFSPLPAPISKKKQFSQWKPASCVGVCNLISFHFRFHFEKPH